MLCSNKKNTARLGVIACDAQLCFIPLEGKNKSLAPKVFHVVASGLGYY